MAGMRPFGEIFTNASENCCFSRKFTYLISYGRPHSSNMMVIFQPFGVGQKCRSIDAMYFFLVIVVPDCRGADAATKPHSAAFTMRL